MAARKYLITGGCGQLGPVLARYLREVEGRDNVIVSDILSPDQSVLMEGPFIKLNVTDEHELTRVIEEHKITCLIHFAALLSATAEKKIKEAFDLNVHCLSFIFLLAKKYGLKLFIPSTIGAFGSDSPLDPTPDFCIQRPTSLYGVSKVYAERLGEYFHSVHGVDFRSLRYPGIISATQPGGGTTDYAVDVFFQGIKTKTYECYLKPDTKLPFAHIDDAMKNTVKFIMHPNGGLKQRVYNYGAFSMTPEQLFDSIRRKCIPELSITYKVDPLRQKLADSWPKTFDFSNAIKDWQLENEFDLDKMVLNVYDDLLTPK